MSEIHKMQTRAGLDVSEGTKCRPELASRVAVHKMQTRAGLHVTAPKFQTRAGLHMSECTKCRPGLASMCPRARSTDPSWPPRVVMHKKCRPELASM